MRFASVTPKQPSAILTMVEGSVPRAACRAHSATMNGVKAKIMNGLNAWNHVVGNLRRSRRQRSIARSVYRIGPQRDGVALLLIGRPEQRVGNEKHESAR